MHIVNAVITGFCFLNVAIAMGHVIQGKRVDQRTFLMVALMALVLSIGNMLKP